MSADGTLWPRAASRTCRPATTARRCAADGRRRAAVIEKPYDAACRHAPRPAFTGREPQRRRDASRLATLSSRCARSMPDDAGVRLPREHDDLPAGRVAAAVEVHVMEHGLLMLEGGGIYRLGDALVSGQAGRLHLDGAVLPAVVRRARQGAGEVPDLQGLESAPAMTLAGSTPRSRSARSELRDAGRRSPTRAAPAVTRVVFTETRPRRARLRQAPVRGGRARRCARTPSATPSRAGPGTTPALPAVATGSHIDAIPNAGRYDGTVGVLGGLEAIRALQRSGLHGRGDRSS